MRRGVVRSVVDRPLERGDGFVQPAQAAQQGQVVGHRLAEPDARVDDQPLARSRRDTRGGRMLAYDDRLKDMDAMGVDMQLVSPSPAQVYFSVPTEVAVPAARKVNEGVAAFVAGKPDHFVGIGTVPLQDAQSAVAELEHCVQALGLKGAEILTYANGRELSDPAFEPFWAKAEELGILIFIHPQSTPDLARRFKGNGWLSNVIGNPLDTTLALSHLILEGTLDRFPGLKICAAHGGGYLPSYAARSDAVQTTFPNRMTGTLKKRPTEYLRQLYFDSIVFTPEALRHLAAEAGPGQIVMGTDYPFPWTSTSVDHILQTPGLSDAEKIAMLGGTAIKLLGIDDRPRVRGQDAGDIQLCCRR